MAIYVDNLGDSSLPVTLNNPQEGEALVWDPAAGAFVNAPQSSSTEVIQDTVADMLEVDPDGTNVALRLLSTYDDVTGKLTFNVVADPGTGGGGTAGVVVKENGTTRGTATTLDFNGASVSFASGTATITGLLDSIGIKDTGVNVGDVQNFDFHGFDLTVSGDTVTVMAPDLTGIISSIEVQQGGVVKGDVTKLNFSGATIGVAGDTATITITGGGGGGGASVLDDLTDVVLTGVTNGQVLKFNGTNWVNAADSTGSTINSLDDIGDVDLTGLGSGLILGYDGTKWVPVANSGSTGPQGPQGPAGAPGATVSSASVSGGTLTLTLDDGTSVVVSGSVAGPQGVQGATGATGSTGPAGASVTAATVSVTGRLLITLSTGTVVDAGNVSGISSATVDGSGDLILTKQDGTTINAGSVIGPQGPQGIQGTQGIKGDTGDTGVSVNNAIVDGSGNLIIYTDDGNNFNAGSVVGPQGPAGAKGDTGEYIVSATVDGSGDLQITTSDSNVINAGSVIGPQGTTGATGPQGPAATVTVGTVTTGAEGTSVIVTNSGTSGAAVLDFTIPKGDTGPAFTLNSVSGSADVYGITSTSVPGYDLEVDTANKWRTARSLSLTGKVTGLATGIDGSGNISITTSLSGVSTDDVTEGSTNLYHTTARARGSVSANTLSGITYNNTTGVFSLSSIPTGSLASSTVTINGTSITLGGSGTITTSNITEGTNQYFTNTRADARADVRIAASSINALSDVDTATTLPTSGQALVWNGSAWVPGNVSGGGGLSGVTEVNGYNGIVTLVTDDIAEDASPTNKWFTDARARAAISAGGSLSYNSSTGVISYTTPTTDGVTEGSTNLYYTNARFDTRLGQSNLSQLNDVADTSPTSGQVLAWNSSTSKWTPSSSAGGSGTTLERLAVQVDYDASGNLTGVTVLNGSGSATITAATAATAEVEFTLTGFSAPPISTVVYGYQRASNVYTMRHVDNATWTTKKFAAGGSTGSPTMWSGWDPTVHKLTLTLTRSVTLASASVGQTTHCVVQITGVA